MKSLLAGSTTGATVLPDNRAVGAALGSLAEVVPAALKGAGNVINRFRVKPKEKALGKAMADLFAIEQEEKSLKNIASHRFGQQNPERLLLSAEDKAKELLGL